jgi:hypothetical protein
MPTHLVEILERRIADVETAYSRLVLGPFALRQDAGAAGSCGSARSARLTWLQKRAALQS